MSRHADVNLQVPVPWTDWLTSSHNRVPPDTSLCPNYWPYFYVPGIARATYAATMRIAMERRRDKILRQPLDAVLVSWAYPDGVALGRLLRRSSIPYYMKVHGSDVNVHCREAGRRTQVLEAMENAAGVFSVSEAMKSTLVDYGVAPEKIHVVYNGVNGDLFCPIDRQVARKAVGIQGSHPIILFVGNLLESKGAVDLIRAFRRMCEVERFEKIGLYYAGTGKDHDTVRSIAGPLISGSASAEVRLLGEVPHKKLNAWINASNVLCLPSHAEGVPNVLLEAMSSGVPVVATRVGGIPEVVPDHAGLLVEPGDQDQLVAAMSSALSTQWNVTDIRQSVSRHSWDGNARAIVSAIRAGIREKTASDMADARLVSY